MHLAITLYAYVDEITILFIDLTQVVTPSNTVNVHVDVCFSHLYFLKQ